MFSIFSAATCTPSAGRGYGAVMIYFEDLEPGAETYFGSYEVTREEVDRAIDVIDRQCRDPEAATQGGERRCLIPPGGIASCVKEAS